MFSPPGTTVQPEAANKVAEKPGLFENIWLIPFCSSLMPFYAMFPRLYLFSCYGDIPLRGCVP